MKKLMIVVMGCLLFSNTASAVDLGSKTQVGLEYISSSMVSKSTVNGATSPTVSVSGVGIRVSQVLGKLFSVTGGYHTVSGQGLDVSGYEIGFMMNNNWLAGDNWYFSAGASYVSDTFKNAIASTDRSGFQYGFLYNYAFSDTFLLAADLKALSYSAVGTTEVIAVTTSAGLSYMF